MQEQKSYQIEKVEHFGFAGGEEFLTTYYYPSGKLSQSGYFYETLARFKTPYQTGMWRIKQQNLKQSKN